MLTPSDNNNNNNNNNMANASGRRGAFVVLEGIDRSGKTSQCKLLLQRLVQAGLTASAVRFPNRTTATGRIINDYLTSGVELDDRAIHLLFSANRWEASQQLCQDLYQGTTVVCDRYAYSGVAFSSAKVAKQQEPKNKNKEQENNDDDDDNASGSNSNPLLSLDWCQAPDRGLPAPDCVIFLQLSPAQAEERGGYGEERYETLEMQLRVRERFAELQKMDQSFGVDAPSWHIIDAAQTIEQVQSEIWQVVDNTLASINEKDKPLQKLWETGVYESSTFITTTKDDEDNIEGGN
mmetsp:Transcript_4749/g.6168  ORF Transcript_4749/g.6168 Transcript_4749/m.6168 type:complete len:293 (+) Transcript_4749:95-973(+)